MKTIKLVYVSLASLFSLFEIGCGTPKLLNVLPDHQFQKSYKTEEITNASVGNPMIRIENVFVRPAFTPKIEYRTPSTWAFKGIEIKPGEIWIARFSSDKNPGYLLKRSDFKEESALLHVNIDGTIGRGWVNSSGGKYEGRQRWTKEQLFERITSTLYEPGSFVCELIYTGISGKSIKLNYREFIDEMARPAFYQDLTYDLNEGDIITFKSVKIKIAEATNSQIVFYVLEDGGLPWVPRKIE